MVYPMLEDQKKRKIAASELLRLRKQMRETKDSHSRNFHDIMIYGYRRALRDLFS